MPTISSRSFRTTLRVRIPPQLSAYYYPSNILTLFTVVTLGIGQRTDVLVTGLPSNKGGTGAYAMRSSIAGGFCSFSSSPDAVAIAYYNHDAVASGAPATTPWPAWVDSVTNQCANVSLTCLF